MLPNTLPNTDPTSELREGPREQAAALALNLNDQDILDIIGKRIENGKTFYDRELNLTTVRDENEKRWLNMNLEVGGKSQLYKFQTPYRDNRIFLSIETLAPNITSRPPMPIVTPGTEGDIAQELAENYQKVLFEKARILNVKGALQMAVRHLLIGYRIGWIKIEWNPNGGMLTKDGKMTGDVKVSCVRPHKIVIDEGATDLLDIPLIAEQMTKTAEELLIKFPEKKKEIYALIGAREKEGEKISKRLLGTSIDYWEVWFSYFEDGVRKEGVAWKVQNTILGAAKNPTFIYDDPQRNNYFAMPMKPYIPMSFLRLGRWIYDDTSLTEQAGTLQDVLEKRGRQIVENADAANSTKVFNTTMVSAKDIQRYNGDPSQSIGAKGDVRMAFKREAPAQLPSYVLQDKFDARSEIDNIFGVHAPLRGERTDSPTLGQEVMSQRSDLGRMGPLVDVLETTAVRVYEWMTQLYKVFGDESHFIPYAGENGDTSFIEFNKDKIADGLMIKIEQGSMMPNDKEADRRDGIELAKLGGRIDPLTFFQKMHIPNPKEAAKRLIYFLWTPDRYMSEVLGEGGAEEGQQQAQQTISRINGGENVPPMENPSKEYIALYNQYIQSPAFKQLDPEIQRLHIEHIRGTIELAKGAMNNGGKAPEPEKKPGFIQALMSRMGGGV